MENNENKPIPENPKPTDEVQLNIETVTPETEKDVVPTEDVTSERSKEPEIPTYKEEENEDSGTTAEKNPAVDEISKDDSGPDDARDEIETVSP